MDTKFIFVTGGVLSSLGKGLASASIGCLLESRGFRVTLLKCDPYVNVDPGTMSPFQHGEVFVACGHVLVWVNHHFIAHREMSVDQRAGYDGTKAAHAEDAVDEQAWPVKVRASWFVSKQSLE